MRNILFLAAALLFASVIPAGAQNANANKSTAYAVKANTHKKKSIPRSVTRKHKQFNYGHSKKAINRNQSGRRR